MYVCTFVCICHCNAVAAHFPLSLEISCSRFCRWEKTFTRRLKPSFATHTGAFIIMNLNRRWLQFCSMTYGLYHSQQISATTLHRTFNKLQKTCNFFHFLHFSVKHLNCHLFYAFITISSIFISSSSSSFV